MLVKILEKVISYLIYGLVLLLPVLFVPLTSEYYETAKFLLLGLVVLLVFILWGLKIILDNRLSLVKTPLDFLLIFYLLVALASTILSPTPFTALYGLVPKFHGGLVFLILVVIGYFMIVSNIKSSKQTAIISTLMVFSGLVAAIISLLAYFKFYLPWQFAQIPNFSLTGSSLSLVFYLTLIFPICLTNLLNLNYSTIKNRLLATFYPISTLIFSFTIVLIGTVEAWIMLFVGGALASYFYLKTTESSRFKLKSPINLILILLLLLVGVTATLTNTPKLADKTIFGKLAKQFPKEIQLPLAISWKISASSFRDSPVLGSGPATYIYNFTQYRPIEYNQTPMWNNRVSSAHDQILQTWAETGGAGVLVMLLIASTFVFLALRNPDKGGLAAAGVTFVVLLFLAPLTVLTHSVGFLILALFMASHASKVGSITEINFSAHNQSGRKVSHILVPSLMFLPILLLGLTGLFVIGRVALAEYYHRQALNSVSSNKLLDVHNQLVTARIINPDIDLYRVELAQANFVLANTIAINKGPSEASPAGSLTQADRADIETFLRRAINEAKSATEIAPRSAANREILANLYRQIAGVANNAIPLSIDSYNKAIALDPLNPNLRLIVGSIYYQFKNYDLAVRFFDDAATLKPDYPNALYNLSLALREKGSTADAIRVAERLVSLLQDKPESQDYETATKLLAELKEKGAEQSKPKDDNTSNSALEQQNLPKVLDLEKPDKVSTPAAVKKAD